jgi:hypothetical protein
MFSFHLGIRSVGGRREPIFGLVVVAGKEIRNAAESNIAVIQPIVNYEPKRDEVTGGWNKLRNEEFHNLYFLPNIMRIMADHGSRARMVGSNPTQGMDV